MRERNLLFPLTLVNIIGCLVFNIALITIILVSTSSSPNVEADIDEQTKQTIECEFSVVGGGMGGLFMAEEIVRRSSKTVCVFEKEYKVGGRAWDDSFPEVPNVTIGLGAWRILYDQPIVWDLVQRFNITTTPFVQKPTYAMCRSTIKQSNQTIDDIRYTRYQSLDGTPIENMTNTFSLLSYTMEDEQLESYINAPGAKSYYKDVLTPEGWEFFRCLFASQRGDDDVFSVYGELLAGANGFSNPDAPPRTFIGGISKLAFALANSIKSYDNGHIFVEEPVLSLHRLWGYSVGNFKEIGQNKQAIKRMTGEIVEELIKSPQFQSVSPFPVFKGAALFETDWWRPYLIDMAYFTGDECVRGLPYPGTCFGKCVLIGIGRGPNGEAILHTYYTVDDCAVKMQRILSMGQTTIDAQTRKELQKIFPQIEIPEILKSTYKYWEAGWHFQTPRSYTFQQTHEWARNPINTTDVYVVSEAFADSRGWMESAFTLGADVLEDMGYPYWNTVQGSRWGLSGIEDEWESYIQPKRKNPTKGVANKIKDILSKMDLEFAASQLN